jgi:hypothetical protein
MRSQMRPGNTRLVPYRRDLHRPDVQESGQALEDPSGLFNACLEGEVRRTIDLHEGDQINETATKALIQEAAAFKLERKKESGHRTGRGRYLLS